MGGLLLALTADRVAALGGSRHRPPVLQKGEPYGLGQSTSPCSRRQWNMTTDGPTYCRASVLKGGERGGSWSWRSAAAAGTRPPSIQALRSCPVLYSAHMAHAEECSVVQYKAAPKQWGRQLTRVQLMNTQRRLVAARLPRLSAAS